MDNTVVKFLKGKQASLKLTDAAMADSLKISAAAYSYLLAGREPSRRFLRKVYQAFPDSLKAITDDITTPDEQPLEPVCLTAPENGGKSRGKTC